MGRQVLSDKTRLVRSINWLSGRSIRDERFRSMALKMPTSASPPRRPSRECSDEKIPVIGMAGDEIAVIAAHRTRRPIVIGSLPSLEVHLGSWQQFGAEYATPARGPAQGTLFAGGQVIDAELRQRVRQQAIGSIGSWHVAQRPKCRRSSARVRHPLRAAGAPLRRADEARMPSFKLLTPVEQLIA